MKFKGVEWPRWWYFPFMGMAGLLVLGTITVVIVWTGGTVSEAEKARLPVERDREPGVAQLDEAIRLNPGYTSAYVKRARARFEAGDFEGALADVEVGLGGDARNQDLLQLRAKIRAGRAGVGTAGSTTRGTN